MWSDQWTQHHHRHLLLVYDLLYIAALPSNCPNPACTSLWQAVCMHSPQLFVQHFKRNITYLAYLALMEAVFNGQPRPWPSLVGLRTSCLTMTSWNSIPMQVAKNRILYLLKETKDGKTSNWSYQCIYIYVILEICNENKSKDDLSRLFSKPRC